LSPYGAVQKTTSISCFRKDRTAAAAGAAEMMAAVYLVCRFAAGAAIWLCLGCFLMTVSAQRVEAAKSESPSAFCLLQYYQYFSAVVAKGIGIVMVRERTDDAEVCLSNR